MKKTRIALLIIAILFNTDVFSQNGDIDGDGVLDKDDICPTEKGTIKNNGCPEQIAKPPKNDTFSLEDNFKIILDDGKYDFSDQIGENILENGSMKHFKYKTTLGGKDEIVLKTLKVDGTINTIYFKSNFNLTTKEEIEKAMFLQLEFMLLCTNYQLDKNAEKIDEVDAMKNKKTILKDKLGNTIMLLVEKPNNAGITLFIYGKSANKK